MTPQLPFKVNYNLTQGYADNLNNYPEGHHGGLDMVPRNAQDQPYPADIYPLFDGSTISIQNTDPVRGEGVKEKVICDADFVAYLKSKGVVPQTYTGEVRLEILYWHILQALDFDGTLTQDTPIAKCGNTGWVFSGGVQVSDNMKGVAPYPGLHLHLETVLKGNVTFNLDKDVRGRIDPQIILAYKGNKMNEFVKTINDKGTIGVVVFADTTENFKFLCKQYNVEAKIKPDGTIETDITI